jgi:hypothetical protein
MSIRRRRFATGCQSAVDDKDKGKEISLLATFNI